MDGLLIKYNDDGEPAGTAGAPILKLILEQSLSNILVVVTRYFGGILLGTGGLVRAYTFTTSKALEKTEYINKIKGYEVKLQVQYSDIENIKYNFNKMNIKVLNIEYLENIEIIVEFCKQDLEEFTNINSKKTFKILKYDILKEKYIDK